MTSDLTPGERRDVMRQLWRAAGLQEDEQRLDLQTGAFDGIIGIADRLRAADVDEYEPAPVFRPLEVY